MSTADLDEDGPVTVAFNVRLPDTLRLQIREMQKATGESQSTVFRDAIRMRYAAWLAAEKAASK